MVFSPSCAHHVDAESRLPPAPPPLPRGMSVRDDDEGGAGWVGHDGDMPDDKAWVWNSATAKFELKWKWEALLPEKPRDRPSWADATSPLPEGDEQVHSDQHDQHDTDGEPTDGPSTLAQPPSPIAINSGENDQHVTAVEPTEQRSTVAQPASPATSSSAGGEHVATADVTAAVSVKHPSVERTAGGDAIVPGESDANDAGAVDDAPCNDDDDAVVGPATSSSSSHGDHEGMRSASVTSMDNALPPHDAPNTASPSTPSMPVDGGAAGVDAQHVEQLASGAARDGSLHLVRADTPPSLNELLQSSQPPLDELDQHAGNQDALQAAAQPDEPTVAAPQPTPLPDVSHEAEAGNTEVSLVGGASPAHNDSCEPGEAVVASPGRPATMTSDNMMSPCADADTHNGGLSDHDDNTTASVTTHNRGEEPRHTSDSSANDESDGSDSHSGSDRSSDEGAQDDKQPGKKAPSKSKKAAKRKTSKTNKQKRRRRSSGKLPRRKGKLSGSGTTGKPSAGLADTVKPVKQGRRRRGKAREARLRTDGPGDGKHTSEGGKPKPHSRRGSKATPKPSTRRRSSSKSSAARRRKSSARKVVTAGTAGHEGAASAIDAGEEPQLGVPPLTNGVVVQFMPLGKEGRLRAAEERRRQARRARWEQEVQERMAKLEGLAGDDLAYALVKSSHNVTGASLQRRIARGKRVVPKLQAIFRGQRVRSALVRLHFNAVVIQCAFRQWVARWTRYGVHYMCACVRVCVCACRSLTSAWEHPMLLHAQVPPASHPCHHHPASTRAPPHRGEEVAPAVPWHGVTSSQVARLRRQEHGGPVAVQRRAHCEVVPRRTTPPRLPRGCAPRGGSRRARNRCQAHPEADAGLLPAPVDGVGAVVRRHSPARREIAPEAPQAAMDHGCAAASHRAGLPAAEVEPLHRCRSRRTGPCAVPAMCGCPARDVTRGGATGVADTLPSTHGKVAHPCQDTSGAPRGHTV